MRAERAGGGGRTARRYLDFVIDGTRLSSRLRTELISPLGWGSVPSQIDAIERLRGRVLPDLPMGRTALYVRPECGDLGCGAVSVLVERGRGVVVWRHFGFQYPCEDGVATSGFEHVGPFAFEGRAYHRLLEELKRRVVREDA